MKAYRITRSRFADMSGDGGLMVDGRWHSLGHRIVYAAAEPGLAMLEVIVHLHVNPSEMPPDHVMMVLELPEAPLQMPGAEAVSLLGDPHATRRFGDGWLEECESLALEVPSVIVPKGRNVLINPVHPDIERVSTLEIFSINWDDRLFEGKD